VLTNQRHSYDVAANGANADGYDRAELQVLRIIVSILIPVALYFYSHWLAAIIAVPCGIACYWYVSQ